LGYWATNQSQANAGPVAPWIKPNQLYPGLVESLGRFNLSERARYSLLTDGGHFPESVTSSSPASITA
jgi:hypothetical protein